MESIDVFRGDQTGFSSRHLAPAKAGLIDTRADFDTVADFGLCRGCARLDPDTEDADAEDGGCGVR